jgi:hypothetical protein
MRSILPPTLNKQDRGAAILILTGILSFVALSIGLAYFMQSRGFHKQVLRERAKQHARYCSEYAVARYGLPTFLQNPELYELGEPGNNWITPIYRSNIFDNGFMADDSGQEYSFAYDSLKMDKVFDQSSRRPFYYVSAQGVVTWHDNRGDHEVRHRSAVAISFNDFSRFMYFSNGEISMEGGSVSFKAGDELFGRIHINGQMNVSSLSCCPIFHGFYTQTEESINGLTEGQYPSVFQGGWQFPYPPIAWPPQDAIAQIKEQHLPNHTYDAFITIGDGMGNYDQDLTTFIKFNHRQYSVAQYYSDRLDAHGDTIYIVQGGQNWVSKNIPMVEGRELIWVKGVCRVEGIVQGKITLLASDSLFITDNVITSDTDLSSCGNEDRFGIVPVGSPNRIGLASERDIIIASTLPNGFANGRYSTTVLCGIDDDSNVNSCDQARKDVIITAALSAFGCSFEAEFWNTTARAAPHPPTGGHPDGCFGGSYTHVYRWGVEGPACAGAPNLTDERGTIWICGSVTQTHRGFVYRNPPGPWGNAWIGYFEKKYRYDNNFLSGGPPVWFRVKYEDGSQDVATEMVVPDYDRWRRARKAALVE